MNDFLPNPANLDGSVLIFDTKKYPPIRIESYGEVEVKDLPTLGWLKFDGCGQENLYFTMEDGRRCHIKHVFNPPLDTDKAPTIFEGAIAWIG